MKAERFLSEPVAGSAEDRREPVTVSLPEHSIRIRDLAAEFDVTLRALRFYEGRGLLAPERKGTQRLYSQRDRERLRTILLAKRLGFSLSEVRDLIPLFDAALRDPPTAARLRRRLDEQGAVLRARKQEVDAALASLPDVLASLRGR